MNYSQTKRSINADEVIDRFKKHRIKLSKSDAEKYIDLLYFLANKLLSKTSFPPKKILLADSRSSNHILGLKIKVNNYITMSYKNQIMRLKILPSVRGRMGSNQNVPPFDLNKDQNLA